MSIDRYFKRARAPQATLFLTLFVALLALSLLFPGAARGQAPFSEPGIGDKIGPGVLEAVRGASAPGAKAKGGSQGAYAIVSLRAGGDLLGRPRAEALREEPQRALRALREKVRAAQNEALGAVGSGFRLDMRYEATPAFTGWIKTEEALARLAQSPVVERIDLDGEVRAYPPARGGGNRSGGARSGASSRAGGGVGAKAFVPAFSAEESNALPWHEEGVTGEGVVVAVIDGGIDRSHPDLRSDLAHEACFMGNGSKGTCPDGSTRQIGPGSALDEKGHGTSVSGTITSDGIEAPVGMAPGAKVVALKVGNEEGEGTWGALFDALDYVAARRELGVKVVNMSLGSKDTYPGVCDNATSISETLASLTSTLRAMGVLVVAGSGNNSSGTGMIYPACLSSVFSVGSYTAQWDMISDIANTNAELDVLGPGFKVMSTALGGGRETYNGTSAATPHAAGCAALLLEAYPASTPAMLEEMLRASPVSYADTSNGLSFPVLDCRKTGLNVEVTRFEVSYEKESSYEGQTRLSWTTGREAGLEGFYVERSVDGGPYERRAFIESKSGKRLASAGGSSAGGSSAGGSSAKASGVNASGLNATSAKQTHSYAFSEERPLAADTLKYRLRERRQGSEERVYRPTTVAVEGPEVEGAIFELAGANPTRGPVTLYYELQEPGEPRLAVYDALGRKVKEVGGLSGEPGRHVARLDLSRLSSGMYFARLKTEEKAVTRRIVLVR